MSLKFLTSTRQKVGIKMAEIDEQLIFEMGYNRGFKDGVKGSILKSEHKTQLKNILNRLKDRMKDRDQDNGGEPLNAVDRGYHLAYEHLCEEIDNLLKENKEE